MKKYLILVPIWLILATLSGFIGFRIVNPMADYRLSKDGVMVMGRVTKKEPENHRFITYTYVAGGQTYNGLGNGGNGNPDFEDISIGQDVVVFYDPGSPQISSLGYPKNHYRVNLAGVVFVTLLLPLFIMVPLCVAVKFIGSTR